MTADHAIGWAVVAAKGVAGRASDAVIDVMQASGSTLRGRVVLRIEVRNRGGNVDPRAAACFQYRLEDTHVDGEPHRLPRCPSAAPLDLSRIAGYAGITPAVRQRVAALLQEMPANSRLDPEKVRTHLAARLGLGYFVRAQPDPPGLLVQVNSGTQCLDATASRTGITVGRAAHGTDCLGG